MQPFRSILFVPGHRPAWVDKAIASGADCVVLDLEDSVPAEQKADARMLVADAITRVRQSNPEVGLFVRVNPLATRLTGGDLEAVVVPGLTGIFAPKVEDSVDVRQYDALLDHFELRNGVTGLEYIVPVETVKAIQNCREVAGASLRVGAMIGPSAEHADIAREVGYEWTPEGLETLYLRSRVLLACREHGLHALTGLWEDLENLDGLREFAVRGRQLGFRGMIAIHPSHVSTVNDVFSPSADDIAFYEGLATAYEQAAADGVGALRYRGLHIDKAHYDKATQWLDRARRTSGGQTTTTTTPIRKDER
ncbi:HpcH/HpaI aldolase/citrate lyase family protein [Gordonia zhaorongruii]|uniref:HpcH/HpaI aldolase/citrate lyase family protein n=1 Tax=Gordonia zhaorongruii TaxID=2597659 RepID=UPI00104CB0DA|nr:CoA ester lyase [Gordonia zhaorongruii]